MALYMLDTDMASYLVKGTFSGLDAWISTTPHEQLCISAVTRGEMLYGIRLKEGAHRLAQVIDQFLRRMPCLAWDESAATRFADVAAELHKAGTPIGSMDAMIAGHAMAAGAVLVSNNARHFGRISGLRLENWAQGQQGH